MDKLFKKILNILFLFSTISFLVACSYLDVHDEVFSINEILENNEVFEEIVDDIDSPLTDFFGTWLLEKLVFEIRHISEFDPTIRQPVGPIIIVEDFIGYEIEFTKDFVRLGERKLINPDYSILNRDFRVNIQDVSRRILTSSNEQVFIPRHYNSVDELLYSIGYFETFINIFIRYPEYDNLFIFDSESQVYVPQRVITDTLLIDSIESRFNPLFQNVRMLGNNHLLVGSGTLLLATRIE